MQNAKEKIQSIRAMSGAAFDAIIEAAKELPDPQRELADFIIGLAEIASNDIDVLAEQAAASIGSH